MFVFVELHYYCHRASVEFLHWHYRIQLTLLPRLTNPGVVAGEEMSQVGQEWLNHRRQQFGKPQPVEPQMSSPVLERPDVTSLLLAPKC